MPTTKKKQRVKASKAKRSPNPNQELADLKARYTKLSMEKKFLERAMGDLNFHNNAHDGVVYTNADNQIIYANPYFMGMMGISDKDALLNQPFPDYMWNNETEASRLFKDIKNDGFVREREMALYNREGKPVFAMCSGVANKDEDGKVIGTEIMFCNITSKRTFQAELMEQHALMDAILQSTPDPIFVLDADLKLQRSNATADTLLAFQKGEKPQSLLDLLKDRPEMGDVLGKIQVKFEQNLPFDFEISLSDQHFEFHAAPLQSAKKGWVCVLHNITVRKLTQEMLQHHAFHDGLTQLPNRSFFIDHLQRANLLSKNDRDYHFALLFIDLDSLKLFNDRFGHHVGDQLLYHLARRIESSIRPGDLAARLGGDEFAVFLDRIDDQEKAMQVASRLRENLLQPYRLNDQSQELNTTASIGIALSSESTPDAESLLRKADRAMYYAKKQGGNSLKVFAEETLANS
ncbi:MAG TPA: diguanylate cyclase [Terriglobales bacterium]|nr:diguanylate cyclase [Terriglobales bacterium]